MSQEYVCVKCGNKDYELGEFRAAGGWFSKLFDIQNKKFTTVTCTHCWYVEVYQAESGALGNVLDFLTG